LWEEGIGEQAVNGLGPEQRWVIKGLNQYGTMHEPQDQILLDRPMEEVNRTGCPFPELLWSTAVWIFWWTQG